MKLGTETSPPKKKKKKRRSPKKRSIFQKDDVLSAPSPRRSLRYTCDQIYDTVVRYDRIRDRPRGWRPWWVTFHIVPDEVNTWKANALARKCTRGRRFETTRLAHQFFGFAFNNPDDQLFLDWMGYAPLGPCPQNNPSVVFYCLFFFVTLHNFHCHFPLPGRFAGHWKWKQSVSHNTVVTSHSYQILTCELI